MSLQHSNDATLERHVLTRAQQTLRPEIFARVHTVLLPKDYVRWRLTGELITDCSDAAGTLWLDQAQRAWSEPILSATGLSSAQMPHALEGSATR